MHLSCAFAPAPDTPDHIALAEELGYERAFVYDSPCFYLDSWSTLARAADRTERIGLGSGVAVIDLRHVTVTASALLTLEMLAPGRVVFGVGAGGTAMRVLGQPAARWDAMLAYATAVRALLRGETIQWEGAPVRLMHPPGIAPPFPVTIPVLFGIGGPRGEQVAHEHGDGILTIRDTGAGAFDWHCRLALGTVLDEGEDPASARVMSAAGPGATMIYHHAYAAKNERLLSTLPGSTEFAAAIDAVPEAGRTQRLWEGHLVHVSALDMENIPPSVVAPLTLTGSVSGIRDKLSMLEAQGVTEVMYQPAGPDLERELRAFAQLRRARRTLRAVQQPDD